MNIKKAGALSLATLALAATLSGCSITEQSEKAQPGDTIQDQRDEQPKEIHPDTNLQAFHKDVSPFIDLTKYDKDWIQLAPGEDETGKTWFGTTTPEVTEKLSKQLLDNKQFQSTKDSAPTTAEDQEKREKEGVPKEDLQQMSGIITAEDGTSMSISSHPLDEDDSKMSAWIILLD